MYFVLHKFVEFSRHLYYVWLVTDFKLLVCYCKTHIFMHGLRVWARWDWKTVKRTDFHMWVCLCVYTAQMTEQFLADVNDTKTYLSTFKLHKGFVCWICHRCTEITNDCACVCSGGSYDWMPCCIRHIRTAAHQCGCVYVHLDCTDDWKLCHIRHRRTVSHPCGCICVCSERLSTWKICCRHRRDTVSHQCGFVCVSWEHSSD